MNPERLEWGTLTESELGLVSHGVVRAVDERAGHGGQVVRRVGAQRAHRQPRRRARAHAQRRAARAARRAPPPRQPRGRQPEALAGRAPRLARPRRRLVQPAHRPTLPNSAFIQLRSPSEYFVLSK